MTVDIKGYAFNLGGQAVNDASAEVFEKNGGSKVGSTVTTGSGALDDGEFEFSGVAEGTYDVKVTSGTNVRWRKYDDEIQLAILEAGSLRLRGTNAAYTHVFQGTPTATRTITFPDATGTVALSGGTGDIAVNDDVDFSLGSTSTGDALLRWSTGDSSNEALALGLGDTSQQFHITDKAAIATDWARSAGTHPEVAIHSNTTPATDYLAIGNHDGTTAYIDVVGGTTLSLKVAGTVEATLTGSTLDLQDNAITTTGVVTSGGLTVGSAVLIEAELEMIDGITAGTAAASKALVLDANKDIGTIRNLTIDGTLSDGNYTFDTSGNVSGLGTVASGAITTSGVLDITDATDSSDATGDTGALRTEGGASIAKKLYVGDDASVGGNLTVTGNLNIDGTTTTVDSTTVAVGDSMISLAKDQGTSADAVDFGIYGTYGVGGTAKYAGIFRDLSATGDPWTFFDTLEAEPGTTVNTSGTGYDLADISAGGITAADGFTGDLTGDVTGNASGTAATVTGGTQASITSAANLATVGTIGTGTWQGDAIASAYIAADAITGAKIADDAIDSEHYAAGSIDNEHLADDAVDSDEIAAGAIDTTHIGDNQVTVAKLADIARGSIIVGNASAASAELTIGSDGYVLTSDGTDISWVASTVGDITSVVAGAGMTGGATTGDATLNVIGGNGITANADDIEITAAQTTVTSVYNAALAVGYGASHANINFATDNQIIFDIDGTAQIELLDGILQPVTDVDINLGATDKRFQTLYGQQFHMDASVDGIGNNSYSGMSATLRVGDGAAVAAWDLVCISDVTNEVQVADADAVATSRVIGINPLNATISDNAEGVILFHGFVRNDAWGWTPGATLYLHTGGTGDTISATAPSGTDDCVVPIGVALEADMIYFNPSGTVIEHA